MIDMVAYPIPARQTRVEMIVQNSRFIATAAPAFTVAEARNFIAQIRAEFADASHNVPVYIIGHGVSVTTHCSDDGEPSGTAGRPALAVLTGSGIGDAVLVVTRYFGGTKLGTGGLVRAYSDSTRQLLAALPLAHKVPTHTLLIQAPYTLYERVLSLVQSHQGQVLAKEFAEDISLTLSIPVEAYPGFQTALTDVSHGSLKPVIIKTGDLIIPI